MKKQLITAAIASTIVAGAITSVQASDQDPAESTQRQYIGTGIGAVAGGFLAGPVGVLAGGLIGNLAGKHDAAVTQSVQPAVNTDPLPHSPVESEPAPVAEMTPSDAIMVSQAGDIEPIIEAADADSTELEKVLVSEFGLDVLFLTGSTAVETIYLPRLQAVASVLKQLPEATVHLDGYSDRRGDSKSNLELSTQRLEAVRSQLVQAGVDGSRIQVNALGEQQFVSKPGDLESYTFDRRVVIRFERSPTGTSEPIAVIGTETNI